jgi:hypothetical protein
MVARKPLRRGVSVLELLVAVCIGVLVIGGGAMLTRFARVSTEASLGPSMGAQMQSRKALVELIRELQECIEFVRPSAGATLSYLLARDKLNRVLVLYLVDNAEQTTRAGRPMRDLYLYRYEPDGGGSPEASQRWVLGGVENASFTTLSSGVIQVHLELFESGKTFPFLTAVRARNIHTEAEL